MRKLQLETLESKDMLSVTLSGGLLAVTVDGPGNTHTVSIDSPVAGQIQVTEDGKVSLFNAALVQSATVAGDKNGANVIQNNTAVPSTLVGGKKDDVIFGGTGTNTIIGGEGKDVVYALLGVNTINAADGKDDKIFTNAPAVVVSDANDLVVRFFGANRAPGQPFIGFDPALNDGVLYITPSNNGSSVTINPGDRKDTAVVTYDLGDGNGLLTQTFTGVKAISYFGGSGNDLTNNTTIPNAAYGSAGNDTLFGGVGDFSLLKGSGGNDVLVARARHNDVSGNAGADILLFDGGDNIVRSDATDTVIGAKKKDVRING